MGPLLFQTHITAQEASKAQLLPSGPASPFLTAPSLCSLRVHGSTLTGFPSSPSLCLRAFAHALPLVECFLLSSLHSPPHSLLNETSLLLSCLLSSSGQIRERGRELVGLYYFLPSAHFGFSLLFFLSGFLRYKVWL